MPSQIKSFYREQRFLILLVSILVLLLLSPILRGFFGLKILIDLFYTLIFLSGISAVSRHRRHIYVSAIIALPMLLAIWIDYFIEAPGYYLVGHFFGIVFFIYMIIAIIIHIFHQERVNREVIYAAVVVYLLMGMMWAFVFGAIEQIHPGSFRGIEATIGESRFALIYYSFVTLTTLGYGDISPATAVASSMAILEAIIGQLYLVVQVAWLVGLRVSQNRSGHTN